MSAIETGAPVYQPAQLLNWVYMSLQDTQSGAFDAFKSESDTSPQDTIISKRSAADLSSNYLNNFFHLRSEVQFMSCYALVVMINTLHGMIHLLFFAACQKNLSPKMTMNIIPSYFTLGYFCCPYSKPHLHAFIGLHCGEWVGYEYVFCTLV